MDKSVWCVQISHKRRHIYRFAYFLGVCNASWKPQLIVGSPKLFGNDLHFVGKLLDIVCSARLTRRSDQPFVFLSTDMIVFEGLRPQFLIRSGDLHLSRRRLQKDGPIPSAIVWEGCFYSVGPAGNIDMSVALFSRMSRMNE